MKKIISLFLVLAMAAALALPASAADSATAGTMRLESTEGAVTVKNASGLSVKLKDKMRLYDGYTVKTKSASYAYISLDGSKTMKLDASSEVSVSKRGKKLEASLVSGSIFFNVAKPLKSDEKLNVRTSTMVTGVRGTSACVSAPDRTRTEITLLTGRLEVIGCSSRTGQTEAVEMSAGERITVAQRGSGTSQEHLEIQKAPAQELALPGFAAVEVAKDPDLQSKIAAETELSVPLIVGSAEDRLAADESAAEREVEKVQQQLEKQAQEMPRQEQARPVESMFTPDSSSDSDSSSDPTPSTPSTPTPAPVTTKTLDNPTLEQLQAALKDAALTTINITNAQLTVPSTSAAASEFEVPSGKTLNLNSGTLTFRQDASINGALTAANGATLTVSSGFMTVNGTLTASGTLVMENNGQIANNGTLNTSGDVAIRGGATLTNNKTMTASGTLTVNNAGTLANAGTLTASGAMTLDSGSQLAVGTADAQGAFEIAATGKFSGDGTIIVSPGSSFNIAEKANLGLAVVNDGDGTKDPLDAEQGVDYTNSGPSPVTVSVEDLYIVGFDKTKAYGYEVAVSPAKAYAGSDITVGVTLSHDAIDIYNALLYVNGKEDEGNPSFLVPDGVAETSTFNKAGTSYDLVLGYEKWGNFLNSDSNVLELTVVGITWGFGVTADVASPTPSATGESVVKALGDPAVTEVDVFQWAGSEAISQPTTVGGGQTLLLSGNDAELASTLTVENRGSLAVQQCELLAYEGSSLNINSGGQLSIGDTGAAGALENGGLLTVSGSLNILGSDSALINRLDLTVGDGGRLSVADGGSLTNNGTLAVHGAMTVESNGELRNNGTLTVDNSREDAGEGALGLFINGWMDNDGTLNVGTESSMGIAEITVYMGIDLDKGPTILVAPGSKLGIPKEVQDMTLGSGNSAELEITLGANATLIFYGDGSTTEAVMPKFSDGRLPDWIKLDPAADIYSYENGGAEVAMVVTVSGPAA